MIATFAGVQGAGADKPNHLIALCEAYQEKPAGCGTTGDDLSVLAAS
jgi:hypothetical protein